MSVSVSVRETLAGRHLLVTGFTGFLAKVWVAHLLHHVPDIGRITLVVRPRGKRGSALERVERILETSPVFRPLRARWGDDLGRWLGERLVVLSGDVERPLLGLGSAEVTRLRGSVDAVVHCAGLTDFQPDPLKAIAVNVVGAHHATDLAGRLDARLVHVSTCFVAGQRDGAVPEHLEAGVSPSGAPLDVGAAIREVQEACRGVASRDERVEIGLRHARAAGWPNIYTWSKGLAEHLVTERARTPTTIVRPSIVECARDFPFAGWNEGLNTAGPLAWLISTGFRRLPTRPGNRFDVVPVDDVARGTTLALVHLIAGDAPPVVQLASGDCNPLTFGRTVELTGLGFRRLTRRSGGRGWDRWFQHLDPVAAPGAEQGLLSVGTVRGLVGSVRDGLRGFKVASVLPESADEALVDALSARLRKVKASVNETHETLCQVEHMLDLYRPFIAQHDYAFQTHHVRRLSSGLPPDEEAFRWTVPELDWRHYWVDVEMPGLWAWSIPLIRGEAVPQDPPAAKPLELVAPVARRAASK